MIRTKLEEFLEPALASLGVVMSPRRYKRDPQKISQIVMDIIQ